jgi:hypothetical protein
VCLWCRHYRDLLSWCVMPRAPVPVGHGYGAADYVADTRDTPRDHSGGSGARLLPAQTDVAGQKFPDDAAGIKSSGAQFITK